MLYQCRTGHGVHLFLFCIYVKNNYISVNTLNQMSNSPKFSVFHEQNFILMILLWLVSSNTSIHFVRKFLFSFF